MFIKYSRIRWLVVSALVLSFVLQPIAPVFAEESAAIPTEVVLPSDLPQFEPRGPVENLAPEHENDESKKEEVKEESSEEDSNAEDESKPVDREEKEVKPIQNSIPPIPTPGPGTSTVQLPQSTVKQQLADADVASGALVYSYPIVVPPGRKGATPQLSLNYHSQNNEEGSLFGFGWALSIPSIERRNSKGVNQLYSSSDFSSTFDGELTALSSTQFIARTENGAYLKYAFDANTGWTVTDKQGAVYRLGSTASSRLDDPANPSRVFRWYVDEIRDTNGNKITYEYTKDNGQVYPQRIRYSGFGTDQGLFKVEFNLENRPDSTQSAKTGFVVMTTKRIKDIRSYVGATEVGRHDFSYTQASPNNRSHVSNIVYTGTNEAGMAASDGETTFTYQTIGATNLLSKIVAVTGGITTVTYKPAAQYRDSSGVLLNSKLPFSVYTVERLDYDDKNGVTWNTSFVYEGGSYYYTSPTDRKFAGFGKVTRTDSVGNKLINYYHQGNGNTTAHGEQGDHWALIGKSYKSELLSNQGSVYQLVWSAWSHVPRSGGAEFAQLLSTVTQTFDGDVTHRDSAQSFIYDAATGNLTTQTSWGEVTGASDGTFTDIGADKIVTTVEYAIPTTGSTVLGAPLRVVVKNNANQQIKETKAYYDQLALGQVSLGNPTKQDSWVSGTTYATVQQTVNSYGLVLTETDPRGKVTTYTYDVNNLYPATVKNHLQHTTSYQYSYRLGKPTRVIDPNGAVSEMTFDGLGRVMTEKVSDPASSDPNQLVTKHSVTYTLLAPASFGWKTVETVIHGSGVPDQQVITYTDGFDRPIQARSSVEQDFAVADTVYNSIGQIRRTSLPYFSATDSRTTPTTDATLYTELLYDPMYRVTQTANAVGVITNTYQDWKVTVADAKGVPKDLHKDAFDQLIRVDEHNGTTIYTTSYEYNGNGNLTKLTDALGNVRNFTYDGLGRRLTAEDLHAPSDTTFGTWSYEYNLVGSLKKITDPKGQVINYVNDDLSRVLTEDFAGQVGIEVTHTYDTCPKGKGRVCQVVSAALTINNEYNILGFLSKETKIISGQTYITQYTYDVHGKLLTVKNPDNSEVKYTYNAGGQLETVQRKESTDGAFGNLVTDFDYGPHGQVTYQAFQNGSVTINTYDPAKLYRLGNKTKTLVSGMKVQDLTYSYDPNSNITRIVDSSLTNTKKTVDYTYDSLNRLLTATATGVASGQSTYTHTFTYDALGNILTRAETIGTSPTLTSTYAYEGNTGSRKENPHAVTKITPSSGSAVNYTYDNNGNLLTETSGLANAWDYNNRLAQTVKSGVTSTYAYDVSGQRVKQVAGTVTTVYSSKFYNLEGTSQVKHVFAGDELLATIKGTGASAQVWAMHTDHLGSVGVVTTSSGLQEELLDYYPFGGTRLDEKAGTFTEQRGYIGEERDSTGLSYLNARYYSPAIGRFLSEDAVFLAVGDPQVIKQLTGQELQTVLLDPQNLNSYAYAGNSPISKKDPTGLYTDPYEKAWENYTQAWKDLVTAAGRGLQLLANSAQRASSPENQQKSRDALLKEGNLYLGKINGKDVYFGVTGVVGGTGNLSKVVNSETQLAIRGPQKLTFSFHALERMLFDRGISVGQVKNVIQNAKAFQYFHDGVLKTGYYDSASRILVATKAGTGVVLTVINNVTSRYIENLKNTIK